MSPLTVPCITTKKVRGWITVSRPTIGRYVLCTEYLEDVPMYLEYSSTHPTTPHHLWSRRKIKSKGASYLALRREGKSSTRRDLICASQELLQYLFNIGRFFFNLQDIGWFVKRYIHTYFKEIISWHDHLKIRHAPYPPLFLEEKQTWGDIMG